MNDERLLRVLLAPHVSEKSTTAAEKANQAVFRVLPNATKDEIKAAVEKLFDVKVEGVQTVNMKGKAKRFGRLEGRSDSGKRNKQNTTNRNGHQ
jgi:large subunit ribosomal protein L23